METATETLFWQTLLSSGLLPGALIVIAGLIRKTFSGAWKTNVQPLIDKHFALRERHVAAAEASNTAKGALTLAITDAASAVREHGRQK